MVESARLAKPRAETTVIGKLTSKLKQKIQKNYVGTQPGKFMTSKKVNTYFCVTECSATKIIPWECHKDSPTNGRYNIILGR